MRKHRSALVSLTNPGLFRSTIFPFPVDYFVFLLSPFHIGLLLLQSIFCVWTEIRLEKSIDLRESAPPLPPAVRFVWQTRQPDGKQQCTGAQRRRIIRFFIHTPRRQPQCATHYPTTAAVASLADFVVRCARSSSLTPTPMPPQSRLCCQLLCARFFLRMHTALEVSPSLVYVIRTRLRPATKTTTPFENEEKGKKKVNETLGLISLYGIGLDGRDFRK